MRFSGRVSICWLQIGPVDGNIVLAQGFLPDAVMGELEQQLQPLQDALEGVLADPSLQDTPELPGQPALDLIAQHCETIIAAAERWCVDPMHIESIIFQEKFHGGWATAKNMTVAWPQVFAGANDASVGLAEMNINTAAGLFGFDANNLPSDEHAYVIQALSNNETAIGLIAANVASFEQRLGRDVTLQEATHGHNAGIDALVRDSPIEQGSAISRHSWEHQESIAEALGLR